MTNYQAGSRSLPKKRFTPIADFVLLKVFKQNETPGGVALPDNALNAYETPMGVVVAAGPLCKQVKRGDVVLAAGSTPALKVLHRGEDLVILQEIKLIGIVDPEETD
jgi:co-chaperonin GroES (HSP10)